MSSRLARNPRSLLAKAVIRALNLRPTLILMDTYAWRWGARTFADLQLITHHFTLDHGAITCPLLSIVGEKEYAARTVSQRFRDNTIGASRNPESRLITVGASDGGDTHAMGTNLSLMAQLIFDWLDEVL